MCSEWSERNENTETKIEKRTLSSSRSLMLGVFLCLSSSAQSLLSVNSHNTHARTHIRAHRSRTHTQTEARAIAYRLWFSHESELDCRSANKTYIIPLLCDVRATQRFIHIRHITQSSAEALTTTTQTISSFERHRETNSQPSVASALWFVIFSFRFFVGRIYLFLGLVFA